MKKYAVNLGVVKLFLVSCFVSVNALSQNSYEFGSALPVEGTVVTAPDQKYFGMYDGPNAQLKYEVNAQGIFIHTINIQAISKETIRETGRYFVRNEHIFGVTEDSIPCVFQDDSYYFGVRNSTRIAGAETENILVRNTEESYILNFKSDYGFIPSLFEFRNNQLTISYFDYDSEGKLFRKIKEKRTIDQPEESNLTVIVLEPTTKEWQKISRKELFGEARTFQKP